MCCSGCAHAPRTCIESLRPSVTASVSRRWCDAIQQTIRYPTTAEIRDDRRRRRLALRRALFSSLLARFTAWTRFTGDDVSVEFHSQHGVHACNKFVYLSLVIPPSTVLIWRRLRLRALSVPCGLLCNFVAVYLTFAQFILLLKLRTLLCTFLSVP